LSIQEKSNYRDWKQRIRSTEGKQHKCYSSIIWDMWPKQSTSFILYDTYDPNFFLLLYGFWFKYGGYHLCTLFVLFYSLNYANTAEITSFRKLEHSKLIIWYYPLYQKKMKVTSLHQHYFQFHPTINESVHQTDFKGMTVLCLCIWSSWT
jgi:hypothetical protein